MNIDNTYLTNRGVAPTDDATTASDAARRPPTAAAGAADVSEHVRSPELLELIARVRHAPEVRAEVLQRAAQRLAQGYYLSRDAADKTAEALLGSEE